MKKNRRRVSCRPDQSTWHGPTAIFLQRRITRKCTLTSISLVSINADYIETAFPYVGARRTFCFDKSRKNFNEFADGLFFPLNSSFVASCFRTNQLGVIVLSLFFCLQPSRCNYHVTLFRQLASFATRRSCDTEKKTIPKMCCARCFKNFVLTETYKFPVYFYDASCLANSSLPCFWCSTSLFRLFYIFFFRVCFFFASLVCKPAFLVIQYFGIFCVNLAASRYTLANQVIDIRSTQLNSLTKSIYRSGLLFFCFIHRLFITSKC